MKKRLIRMITLLVLATMLVSCGVQIPPEETFPEYTRSSPPVLFDPDDDELEFYNPGSSPAEVCWLIYPTFDRTIEESSGIVVARLDDIDFHSIGFLLHFSRTKIIWDGDVPENFTVLLSYTMLSAKDELGRGFSKKDIPFEEGTEYVLPLIFSHSVFFASEYYSIGAHACIPLEGDLILSEKVTCYVWRSDDALVDKDYNKLSFSTLQEIEEYIRTLVNTYNLSPHVEGVPYVHSDDPEDIVRGAECIVRVRIDDVRAASMSSCKVSVLEYFKGHTFEEELNLTFYNGTAKVGGEYLLCLAGYHHGEYSSHTIASRDNSVIPMEDTERVEQYLKLIEKYRDQ